MYISIWNLVCIYFMYCTRVTTLFVDIYFVLNGIIINRCSNLCGLMFIYLLLYYLLLIYTRHLIYIPPHISMTIHIARRYIILVRVLLPSLYNWIVYMIIGRNIYADICGMTIKKWNNFCANVSDVLEILLTEDILLDIPVVTFTLRSVIWFIFENICASWS